MKTIWTQDIKDSKSKADYEQALRASPHIQKLLSILEAREKELLSQLISSPKGEAWSDRQTHLSGRLYDLKEIQELLNFNRPLKEITNG